MKKRAWIYIHIPKTAGMFLKQRILESRITSKILDPFSNNQTYSIPIRNAPSIYFVRQQIKQSNDDRVGFVVLVRNPYDRIYSMWKWLRLNGSIGSLDFPMVEENFKDFVLSLSNGNYDSYYFMRKQTFFLSGGEDRFVKIMKFEEINTTVKSFFEENGVIWSDEKVNATFGKHYNDVYDSEMKEAIFNRCEEEFDNFGYSLDI
jgi:hypothetical protein